MDVIENWNLLNERTKEESAELTARLFQIHMGVFDDLRKSGHMLKVGDQPVSELLTTMHAPERLTLAGDIGCGLINAQGDLFAKQFSIQLADYFPNCVFVALAAIFENLEGGFNVLYPDRKMTVVCAYDTLSGNDDPLGKMLPLIEKCYPWVSLSAEVCQTEPPAEKQPKTDKKPGFWSKLFRK